VCAEGRRRIDDGRALRCKTPRNVAGGRERERASSSSSSSRGEGQQATQRQRGRWLSGQCGGHAAPVMPFVCLSPRLLLRLCSAPCASPFLPAAMTIKNVRRTEQCSAVQSRAAEAARRRNMQSAAGRCRTEERGRTDEKRKRQAEQARATPRRSAAGAHPPMARRAVCTLCLLHPRIMRRVLAASAATCCMRTCTESSRTMRPVRPSELRNAGFSHARGRCPVFELQRIPSKLAASQ
jgi:hypothetical protein